MTTTFLKPTAIIFFLFICWLNVYPQSSDSISKVTVLKDERIDRLQEEYFRIKQRNNKLDGFRVQIFFDSGNQSKRNANEAREKFIRNHPHIEAYIDFKEPYYRVRVGDFRTRLEADGLRRMLLNEYSNAFIVNDKINPPSID